MKIVSILSIGLIPSVATSQTDIIKVAKFNKVIVSPHIEANLMEGDEPSVEIMHSNISRDKINIKVEGKTLRIYLDDAKVITKSKKVKADSYHSNRSIYEGTMATVNITYKDLVSLSVRGEEEIVCFSPIVQEGFQLKILSQLAFMSSDLP